jgi:hypothetical protein
VQHVAGNAAVASSRCRGDAPVADGAVEGRHRDAEEGTGLLRLGEEASRGRDRAGRRVDRRFCNIVVLFAV